ncbi:MAG TPA: glycosyltransferase family 2 protein [Nitrospirae bacterium]|nr:UDP-Glc:alpha-D-GlcNAc-diphosphoundecaprenol beta-1,3-glucosyltransferase WfgD [bacterium BMS3Abin06]HDH12776.1 glycosyltransferase family 2 protein [Nitrospirota bacterium]HDZ03334.1 glycosyltransferase family 2 protein [Nitrospirota bacterium]
MEKYISIIIPSYNKAATIGKCLAAAFSSDYKNFEVIVVDDCSEDNSVEIIKGFPCKLIRLETRSGTSRARNLGARNSSGDIIFFTDADCLLQENTLSIANRMLTATGPDVVIGGTYTKIPYDRKFFSIFQSVFINYSETRKVENPDYIAAHTMLIDAETFRKSGGFPEEFLPIIEDVEFSHRLRRRGYKLLMNPEIQVQHIFDFSFLRSVCNAFRKTAYWCMYSLQNGDLLADSGTASIEFKANAGLFFLSLFLFAFWLVIQKNSLLYPVPVIFLFSAFIGRKLLKAFFEARGALFAGLAFAYYIMIYPVPVGLGTITGMLNFLVKKQLK